jgi:hypothetical protein
LFDRVATGQARQDEIDAGCGPHHHDQKEHASDDIFPHLTSPSSRYSLKEWKWGVLGVLAVQNTPLAWIVL